MTFFRCLSSFNEGDIDSIKNDELLSDKELITHVDHNGRVYIHLSPLHNEESASHQHDIRKTCVLYESQDNPVVAVQIVNAMKGSRKRLRDEKHNIHQNLPIFSSSPDRKMRCGMFNSCTSKINRVIPGQDKSMF